MKSYVIIDAIKLIYEGKKDGADKCKNYTKDHMRRIF
jgi:hypothetical protein